MSAIAERCHACMGPGSSHQLERGLKSAELCIQTTPESDLLNWDEGLEMPGCWIATMKNWGRGWQEPHPDFWSRASDTILECGYK